MNVLQTVPPPGSPMQWQMANPNQSATPDTGANTGIQDSSKIVRFTAILHAGTGFILIDCGITVILLRDREDWSYGLDDIDRCGWGIWTGACFVIMCLLGMFSKKGQALIVLYIAFSIITAVICIGGITLAGVSLSRCVFEKDREGETYQTQMAPFQTSPDPNAYRGQLIVQPPLNPNRPANVDHQPCPTIHAASAGTPIQWTNPHNRGDAAFQMPPPVAHPTHTPPESNPSDTYFYDHIPEDGDPHYERNITADTEGAEFHYITVVE